MDELLDTEPAPPPDLETRIAALESRVDQQDVELDEFERYLENKFEILREDIREWFRRRRDGVTNGCG